MLLLVFSLCFVFWLGGISTLWEKEMSSMEPIEHPPEPTSQPPPPPMANVRHDDSVSALTDPLERKRYKLRETIKHARSAGVDATAAEARLRASETSVTTRATAAKAEKAAPINVKHVCESAAFTGAGASHRLDVAIFVFAWKRLASLKRLVASLQQAEYCGGVAAGRMSLTFLMDAGGSPAVEEYVRSVQWAHGPTRVVVERPLACAADARPADRCGGGRGIRGMWIDVMARELEASEPPTAHVLPLEDDIEVSPLYYWWLRRAADAYGPFDVVDGVGSTWGRHTEPLARSLVGVSLCAAHP